MGEYCEWVLAVGASSGTSVWFGYIATFKCNIKERIQLVRGSTVMGLVYKEKCQI